MLTTQGCRIVTHLSTHASPTIMATTVSLTFPADGPCPVKSSTFPGGLFINNEFVPSVDSTEKIEYV